MLGYGADYDIDVKEFVDRVMHPDDRERIAAYRRSHLRLQDGVISQVEFRARHMDGSWRWMLSRNLVFARNEDGTIRQLIGTTTDITAAKRAEEELRRLNAELERRVSERTADLQAANSELEAFAYSVSHDLRGPLRAIGGFSGAVLDSCGDQLDASGRRYLSLVTAGVKRMADMIDGLLALSRSTRNELFLRRVDLSAITSEALADLQHTDPNRCVDTVIIPQAEVYGDARLLRIALDNLLGNAWKYTSRRECARIEFGMQVAQGESIYFVRDNGVGFDMANANALFMPFQRLHSGGEFDGTGIGLATVKRIIHRHGGRIWGQSAPEQGATFYFTLPCVALSEASTHRRRASLQVS
jgi:PAS domain S-box-containing protein